eukprot:TRINITY_DN15796_c0_g1_i1.p1 TRINITY_DN15796_c0_g1~~TRINITY_DN15796_c0_g1_i1.p1  ORF type:complete len:303 (+),score=21.70 TRINITY_DN15796_c0_g1_i1:444-1352(+)
MLIDPVVCKSGRTYCLLCISKHYQLDKPESLFECNTDKILKIFWRNLQVQGIIDQQIVYCLKGPLCKWSGPFERLKNHYEKECNLRAYLCPLRNCSMKLYRWELNDHLDSECRKLEFVCCYCRLEYPASEKESHLFDICAEAPIVCTNKCGETPKRKDLEHHLQNECKLTIIICPNAAKGCKFVGSRQSVLQHAEAYGERHSYDGSQRCERLAEKLKCLKEKLKRQRMINQNFFLMCQRKLKCEISEICRLNSVHKAKAKKKTNSLSPTERNRSRSRSRSRSTERALEQTNTNLSDDWTGFS